MLKIDLLTKSFNALIADILSYLFVFDITTEILHIPWDLHAYKIVGKERPHQFLMLWNCLEYIRRRERSMIEKPNALLTSQFSQFLRERDKVTVMDPEDVIFL